MRRWRWARAALRAPIFDSNGRPWAAISVSGPVSHVRLQDVEQIAKAITEVCQKISNPGRL